MAGGPVEDASQRDEGKPVSIGALETTDEIPDGGPVPEAPPRPEEFAPGLTPELMELMEQAAAMAPKQ